MVSKTLMRWIENITITLYSENGDTLATDITDSNGRYDFVI